MQFVGAATGVDTATLPAHQAGDLIVVFLYRDGSTVPPTLPTGQRWSTIAGSSVSGSTNCGVIHRKTALNNAEAVGSFTNATSIIVAVWRPEPGATIDAGACVASAASGATLTYPAITLQNQDNSSWVALFGGTRSPSLTNIGTTVPGGSGLVNRGAVQDTTDSACLWDTNGPVGGSSFASRTQAPGGSNTGYFTATLEIKEVAPPTGSLNATETGTDTASISGLVVIAGSLAATEAGIDTASISGSVAAPDFDRLFEGWTPTGTELNDQASNYLTLGTHFRVTRNGYITHIRFWWQSNGSSYIPNGKVRLWENSGEGDTALLLSERSYSGFSGASDWKEIELSPPVAVVPNKLYVAAYTTARADNTAGAGGSANLYGLVAGQMTSDQVSPGEGVVAPANGTVLFGKTFRNGSFRYHSTDPDGPPIETFGSAQYGVGVVLASNAGVEGSLSATETGTDTASLAGQVGVAGSLAATETGTDTLTASGLVKIAGSLAATETGIDTATMAGSVRVSGSLSATETGSDTASITGSVNAPGVSGSLSATETGQDTAAASGFVTIAGSLAATETGVDTVTASGQVKVSGSLAATETGTDTVTASGLVKIAGSLTATETGTDTASIIGSIGPPGVGGSLSATETGTDTASISGQVGVSGSLSATETGTDTASMAGGVGVTGNLSATEIGQDQAAISGQVGVTGSLSAAEQGDDTFSGDGFASRPGDPTPDAIRVRLLGRVDGITRLVARTNDDIRLPASVSKIISLQAMVG